MKSNFICGAAESNSAFALHRLHISDPEVLIILFKYNRHASATIETCYIAFSHIKMNMK